MTDGSPELCARGAANAGVYLLTPDRHRTRISAAVVHTWSLGDAARQASSTRTAIRVGTSPVSTIAIPPTAAARTRAAPTRLTCFGLIPRQPSPMHQMQEI